MFLWCIGFYNVYYINKKYLFKYFLLYHSRAYLSILDNRTAIVVWISTLLILLTYYILKYVNKFIEIKGLGFFIF